MRLKWGDLSECRSFVEKVRRAGRILVYTVCCAGYRQSWRKGNICVHLWTDVLQGQAYTLRKEGGNSAIRQINCRLLQSTFSPLNPADVISARRWVRPKQFSDVFLYTTGKENKSYIAVSLKPGAMLQCETEGYSKRSRSHSNCSFRGKETVPERGKWGAKCGLGCALQQNCILTL